MAQRILRIAFGLWIALLLTGRVFTMVGLSHDSVEYALVILKREPSFQSTVFVEDLPTRPIKLFFLNRNEGSETITESLYLGIFVDHFWWVLGLSATIASALWLHKRTQSSSTSALTPRCE